MNFWVTRARLKALPTNQFQCQSIYTPYLRILVSLLGQKRSFAEDGLKGGSISQSKASSTWERGAIAVKNVDITNPYLESIRKTHDPVLHIKSLEDELKGTIGQALGKQGQKILMWMKVMEQEREKLNTLAAESQGGNIKLEVLEKAILSYNIAREKAIKARWELVVHRQAAGFIVNNHKFVHDMFRIAEQIWISDFDSKKKSQESDQKSKKKVKKFGDQLDWWQRIGRWK